MLSRLLLVLTLLLSIPMSANGFGLDVHTASEGPGRMSVTVNVNADTPLVGPSCSPRFGGGWNCYCMSFVVFDKAITNSASTRYPEGIVTAICTSATITWKKETFYAPKTIPNVRTDIPNATICALFSSVAGMAQYHYGCEPLKDSGPPPTATTCTTENTVLLDHGVLTSDQLAGHTASGILDVNCSSATMINFSMSRDLAITGISGVVKILLDGKNPRSGVIKEAAQGMNSFTLESILPASGGVAAGEYSGSEVLTITYL